jgi:hypothetical protein
MQTDNENGDAAVPATVPAATDGGRLVNPFTLFRQRNSTGSGFFRGDLIKCDHRTGEWVREHGEERTLIDAGECFIVNPHEMVDTWTKWVDGKVIDRQIYRTVDGQFAPERDALGDLDERQWPLDRSGRKRLDPWQRAVFLPMKGRDGEVVAFRATGRGAISEMPRWSVRTAPLIGTASFRSWSRTAEVLKVSTAAQSMCRCSGW